MTTLPDVTEHLQIKEGFCHPDWAAITKAIEETLPESEWNNAWETVSRQWVERIGVNLDDDYKVHETANFLILSEAPKRVVKHACRAL